MVAKPELRSREPIRIVEQVSEPQHYVPASARELRAQSIHRLQLGLFGLCAMVLIVALANIIMDRAMVADKDDPIEEVIAVDTPEEKAVVDPLADIGVVPSAEPESDLPEAGEAGPESDR